MGHTRLRAEAGIGLTSSGGAHNGRRRRGNVHTPRWIAAGLNRAVSAVGRVKGVPLGWARTGAMCALLVAGSAVTASGSPVGSRPTTPVLVPVAATASLPTGADLDGGMASASGDSGPLKMVALPAPPVEYRIVTNTSAAPPPPAIVFAPGGLRIPKIALDAYQNAEKMMAKAAPGCGVSWNLLAGIGRIESGHANNGSTDVKGKVIRPIYGPSLDGSLPGNEVILDREQTASRGSAVYVRAVGPMQFLPGTWSRYASDGDGDGIADPQNVYDASLAAARYLCSGGLNLRDHDQVTAAILRYNNSIAYAQNVLAWAAGYATGVIPVNLPPLTAADTAPELKAHLGASGRGLGPGSAVDVAGLSPSDPLAQMPFVNPMAPDRAGIVGPAAPAPAAPQAPCALFCEPAPAEPFNPFAPAPPEPAAPFNPFAPAPPEPAAPIPGGAGPDAARGPAPGPPAPRP